MCEDCEDAEGGDSSTAYEVRLVVYLCMGLAWRLGWMLVRSLDVLYHERW